MSGSGGAIPENNMLWSAATSMSRLWTQYIVSVAGSPFGYLQCYDLTEWNSGFGPNHRVRAASTCLLASQ